MATGTAKLTDIEVIELRARQSRGEQVIVRVEADRFGCSLETIRKILRGDTFRHLLQVPQAVPARPGAVEPTEEEIAANLAAFLAAVKQQPSASASQEADIRALLGNAGEIP